jgi:diguanylate cyclase (GGDEF)-like protein/PAS domain S-box-containing protein
MPDDRLPDGTRSGSSGTDGAVATEQIHLLLQNPIDVPVNLINAGLVAALLWEVYPGWARAPWLALFVIVSSARVAIRHRDSGGNRSAEAAQRAIRPFTMNVFAAGLLWGVTGSAIVLTPNPAYYDFIVVVLCGTMAGGVICTAAYLPAMFAFTVPIMLPAIAALLIHGGFIELAMAVMLVLFFAVLLLTGRSLNRSIVENIRLRLTRELMVVDLKDSATAMVEAQAIAHVGGVEIDVKNARLTCTAEALRIFGFDTASSAPTADAMLARIHPDDRAAAAKTYADFVRTGAACKNESRVVMDDGAVKFVHCVGRASFDAAHSERRLFATVQDITHRHQIESANAMLASIVATSDDAILAGSAAGEITLWNRGAERLLGYSAAEAIGQNIRMIIPAERQEEMARNLATVGRGETLKPFDTENVRKDGSIVPVSVAGSLAFNADGQPTGAFCIERDISNRLQTANALAYRDRLLHASMVGTGMLVKAQSPDLGMPDALRVVGESMRVDRVMVIEWLSGQLPPMALRHHWEVPGIEVSVSVGRFAEIPVAPAVIGEWVGQLHESKPVIFQLATSEGANKAMLQRFNTQSTLLLPIFVRDKFWGAIGADACKMARQWDEGEIDMLRTFAGIASSLIERDETWRALEASEGRIRILNATAQDAIVNIDEADHITQWNQAAERMFGYSEAEVLGTNAARLLSAPARAPGPEALRAASRTPGGRTLDLTMVRKSGAEIAVEASVSGALLGGHRETFAILRDITERKIAQNKLAFANLLLKTQMEASLDGIFIVGPKLKIISFNQRFADMWKASPADLGSDDNDAMLTKISASIRDPEKFRARVGYLYAHPGEDSRDEYQTTDGRFIDRYTVTLYSPVKEYLGRAWFFRDVSEQKRAEAHTLRMARFDVLTGLANRSVFVDGLERAIAAASRGGEGFAVLYLDLDRFKDVNDTLGHPVGDELLKSVADRLRSTTRSTDTVARFGGDEFAVVATNITDPADAAILADKLIQAIGSVFVIEGSDIHTSVSIGIATYGADSPDAETLLSHADVALYRAKSDGRSAYRFFTDAMDVVVHTRVSLGAELRDAVDAGQLFLVYQPQVVTDTGRIIGVEALVRWRHPRLGVLGPDRFIPLAEQIGIIAKIGHWVLWSACRQAKLWCDAGIAPLRTGVNASALEFRSPIALETDIAAALAQTGLPPQRLELELTESALMEVSREHSSVIQRIRATGVSVAIDDFGTGYSSLEYLGGFPIDRIKIPQNFVFHLETAPRNAAIIRATIGLAKELDVAVIAEGVETRKQLDLLKGWGCGEIQGFYFSKPVGVEEVGALLRAGIIHPPIDAH